MAMSYSYEDRIEFGSLCKVLSEGQGFKVYYNCSLVWEGSKLSDDPLFVDDGAMVSYFKYPVVSVLADGDLLEVHLLNF